MNSVQQQARLAGLLYLVLAITAPIGLIVVPGQLFVVGDVAATAGKIAESGWLLRLGIASELFHQAVQIFLLLALYRLLKPVSEALAKQMVILGALVSVPIVFVNVLNEIAALLLVTGAIPSSFAKPEIDGLAYLFVTLHGQGILVVSIFWGLWLFPFGLLVIRSGFIPAIFGYLLLIAGFAYAVGSFATLLLPQFEPQIQQVVSILVIAEIPIVFWLLIWGARTRPSAPRPAT